MKKRSLALILLAILIGCNPSTSPQQQSQKILQNEQLRSLNKVAIYFTAVTTEIKVIDKYISGDPSQTTTGTHTYSFSPSGTIGWYADSVSSSQFLIKAANGTVSLTYDSISQSIKSFSVNYSNSGSTTPGSGSGGTQHHWDYDQKFYGENITLSHIYTDSIIFIASEVAPSVSAVTYLSSDQYYSHAFGCYYRELKEIDWTNATVHPEFRIVFFK